MDLNDIKIECERCRRCELCKTRQRVVFGTGAEDGGVLLIGEAPGANEDMAGEPFVGRSGKLLDSMMEEVGLSRGENVYITNMAKCRPPQNRDPKPEETDACLFWLKAQIGAIKPKIVVCVGRISAQKIISADFRVTRQHGQFFEHRGVLYTATFHPAAILRNMSNKPTAQNDWQIIAEKAQALGVKLCKPAGGDEGGENANTEPHATEGADSAQTEGAQKPDSMPPFKENKGDKARKNNAVAKISENNAQETDDGENLQLSLF